MHRSIRSLFLVGVIFVAPVLFGNCAKADQPVAKAMSSAPAGKPASQPAPVTQAADSVVVLTDAEKIVVAEFEARVADHVTLHEKLEATIPGLPDKATPQQIDQHQQSLIALIATARKDAKPGEFFTPGMEALARRALGVLLAGQSGDTLEETIMDDNPGALAVNVNDRYPDEAPVSSMPLQLLETLPKLPADIEYRFLGKHLVLVCTPARIVLDFTPNVLP